MFRTESASAWLLGDELPDVPPERVCGYWQRSHAAAIKTEIFREILRATEALQDDNVWELPISALIGSAYANNACIRRHPCKSA
jgi:hypothetical protein